MAACCLILKNSSRETLASPKSTQIQLKIDDKRIQSVCGVRFVILSYIYNKHTKISNVSVDKATIVFVSMQIIGQRCIVPSR